MTCKLNADTSDGLKIVSDTSGAIDFQSNGVNKMSMDSSGKLGVGDVTDSSLQSTNGSDSQFYWQGNYGVFVSHDDLSLILNRQGTDGTLTSFRKNGSGIGAIGISTTTSKIFVGGGNMGISLGGSGRGIPTNASGVGSDNQMDWGQSNYRWDDFYATNGTIQTSDRNEKQSIESLTTEEMNVAKRLSSSFKTFKWNSAVEEKGDNARTHTGIIAQDVQQAFTDEGLDASDYALFIYSTWYENSDGIEVEFGTEGAIEKTRLGVRYPELLSFIQAYNDQRFTELEARITALESE